MFREMPVDQIRTNLIKYTNRQIIKLDNLSKQKGDKIADELNNDYENRKATKEKVERLIPGYGGIKQGYINNIENGVKDFMEEYVTNHLAVQELNEYIKKFIKERDKLYDQQYILEYRKKCIALFLNDKVSEAFDDYKLELLEYLIMVLNGVKPEQHPFNIIITGNPGLGKSHLAGEIVKLLQSTHLLPIGKFINLKKPDVIGQYIGQTAPKAYRRLIGGPPTLGLSNQHTVNLGPPPLPLGKSSAANNQLFDFRNMPPPAPELRSSNTESYYDRKYCASQAANSKNQGPPLLTLQGLNTERPPAKAAPPVLSFSSSATKADPPAKKKELPKIDEEIEEEPEKPKAAAKKKNKKRSKPKSRGKGRR